MIFRITLCAIIAFACSSCSQGSAEEDSAFLASDAHIIVGGVDLVVPFVAVSSLTGSKQTFSLGTDKERRAARERLESIRKAAGRTETAPVLEKVEISIRTYGWHVSNRPAAEFCDRLTRLWSKSVCNNPWAALQQSLPNENTAINLIDGANLSAMANHVVGDGLLSERLADMQLSSSNAAIACGENAPGDASDCTAAIKIGGSLIAVWSVSNTKQENAIQQAHREGTIISSFVRDGLGKVENYPDLLRVACLSRRPGSVDGAQESSCPKG